MIYSIVVRDDINGYDILSNGRYVRSYHDLNSALIHQYYLARKAKNRLERPMKIIVQNMQSLKNDCLLSAIPTPKSINGIDITVGDQQYFEIKAIQVPLVLVV